MLTRASTISTVQNVSFTGLSFSSPLFGRGGRQGNDACRCDVLEENPAIYDAFINAGGLVTVLGDVSSTIDRLLQHAEVILSPAANIVGYGRSHISEGSERGGIEDLCRATFDVSNLVSR